MEYHTMYYIVPGAHEYLECLTTRMQHRPAMYTYDIHVSTHVLLILHMHTAIYSVSFLITPFPAEMNMSENTRNIDKIKHIQTHCQSTYWLY